MTTKQLVRTIVAREEGLPLAPPQGNEGGSLKREIPKSHEFEARALKPLARALFSTSVALGHSVTAYKEFARIKSASISPDGMLGGKGYVLKVSEVRAKFQAACELLSALTDTLHDELQGPHWKPKLADLSPNEAEDIAELMSESDEAMQDPEQYGDREVAEIEKKNDGPGGAPKTKKMLDRIQDAEESNTPSGASKLPGSGGNATSQAAPPGEQARVKQAAWKASNSSVPVTTLPGPRVDHLDRGEQTGPGGSYNVDEPLVDDPWGRTEGSPPKTQNTIWGSEAPLAQSGMPNDPDTRTEAFDFGLGYGANGQGAGGYGTKNPDGKGVFGPQSGLPNDPTGTTTDSGGVPLDHGQTDSTHTATWGSSALSELPSDGPDPVARSDYFEGDKGNMTNAPLHGNRGFATSELPAGPSVNYNSDRNLPNTSQTFEQQAVPYVKRDWATKNDRNDLQDLYRMDNNG